MSPDNVVAIAAFFAILMAGLLILALRDMHRTQSGSLIKERMAHVTASQNVSQTVQAIDDADDLFHRQQKQRFANKWLAARIKRIYSVSGTKGVRMLWGSFFVSIVLALLMIWLFDVAFWWKLLILIGVPIFLTRFVYKYMIGRFRTQFLSRVPDTIDLIVRAVRAGIPAVQAISVAGNDAEEPVRSEFRLMGDSLRLGIDLKDVLNDAVERIQIADFSFFSVCLLLQRETGGALTETLENLATIVRSRRDMRLKIRALTGEGRMTTQIIAAIPFVTLSALYVANRGYVMVLFTTTGGRHLLMVASVLMLVGMLLIHKIANLETSR